MTREINILSDLAALRHLLRIMRKVRPVITNVGTPKAGLLGGLASYFSGTPCRVYTLRGLRCETATYPKRALLLLSEWIACRCAHRVICVSDSLRTKAAGLGIADVRKLVVLASGSSNGVDVQRFVPTARRLQAAVDLRAKLKIPTDAPIIGFVGRLTKDKGVGELFYAYTKARSKYPRLRLLLVGDFEDGDKLALHLRQSIQDDSYVVRTGQVEDTAPYYHVMDILALPTHREGFPNVILEAQAAAKPVVTSTATGAVDAIQDGITGIQVPVGDESRLAHALLTLLQEPDLARRMGSAGHERVLRNFRQEIVWEALYRELCSLLVSKGLPIPVALGATDLQAT
jgi:glycosyltransferase involved in cell wall biosynthesis